MDIYYACKRKDSNFEKNMPELPGRMFLTLFDDDSWTWSGFCALFKRRFKNANVEELIRILREEVK